MEPIFWIGLGAIVFGVLAYFGWLQQKKRREALAALGAKLNLQYLSQKDRSAVGKFEFLDLIGRGSNRFLLNRLKGTLDGYQVEAFDFHYETRKTNSKGRSQTRHHYGTAFLLMLPGAFPELRIYREGIFSKIAQNLVHHRIRL